MRLPLSTLEIFEAIAHHGSFKAAADALGVQASTVSHQLKALEHQMGVALVARTTRAVSLTEAGELLFRGCHPAFDQIRAALQAARDAGRSQRGTLRLTMPGFAYDMFVADKLAAFREAYPDVELEISIDETMVDLFENGFHAGIRLGERLDPDMIAIRISPPHSLAVVASPDYLARYRAPTAPQDLVHHECIRYRFGRLRTFAPWEFVGKDGTYSVAVSGKLIVNTLPSLFTAVADGLGLGFTFADYRPNGLASEVIPLLQEHTRPIAGAYLYYPREYKSRELLRLFIDFLVEPMGSAGLDN